jgi:hypothetical protein
VNLRELQPNTFVSRVTTFAASEIWPFIADPMLLPAFSSELQEIRVLGDGSVGLGTTFEGDQMREERTWISLSTVTVFSPPLHFEWSVGGLDDPVSRWTFLIDENPRATTLTHKVVLCGGPSPMSERIEQFPDSAETIVQERLGALRERMAVTLDGLLALVAVQSR